jgi:hypothetical protein
MRVKGPSILNVGCYFELIPGRRRRLCIRIIFDNHLLAFRFQALVVSKIVTHSAPWWVLLSTPVSDTSSFNSWLRLLRHRLLLLSNFQGWGRFWLSR